MNVIIALFTVFSGLNVSADTIRYDGYYLHVAEQASAWHLLYFRANGTFMDSTNSGTPPVFQKEDLEGSRGEYHFRSTKNDYVIEFAANSLSKVIGAPGANAFIYGFGRDELIFKEWLDKKKNRWRDMKESYFFVPF
jgi:hypothetical protein